jgi:hypothetical protein
MRYSARFIILGPSLSKEKKNRKIKLLSIITTIASRWQEAQFPKHCRFQIHVSEKHLTHYQHKKFIPYRITIK